MDKRDKKEMNRREFLKIVGVSTVASTVAMYGCASGEKSNASEASILGEVPVYMDVVEILSGKVCRRPEAIWVKSRQIR